MPEPILVVDELSVSLGAPGQPLIVGGLGLELHRGRTFALLGESGCGKTMSALAVMRLLPATMRISAGQVLLDGTDLVTLPESRMRAVRGLRIAMIFQDPQTSLNPVMTVERQISEVLSRVGVARVSRRERAIELLDQVGIAMPRQRIGAYPHQLSGGMKQRVSIAMALAGEPDVLIADEPTTALDVTIQAQILRLLRNIQRSTDMAIMLITHDLGVVAHTADEVGVMYAGHLVERASVESFFAKPYHPYAQGLFAAIPRIEARERLLSAIPGSVPMPSMLPRGCRFQSRCAHAWDECAHSPPHWREHSDAHYVRCHLYEQVPAMTPTPPLGDAAGELTEAPAPRSGVQPLLGLEDVRVDFSLGTALFRKGDARIRALNGISLSISPGRTLAVVGESGCGKSTLAKAIVNLVPSQSGRIFFQGVQFNELDSRARKQRCADVQIIFQDTYASMNPRMRAVNIVAEGLTIQKLHADKQQRKQRALDLLAQVGIEQALSGRYPHELSGGQRQRVCIARALAVEPKLIVCDEPTSALDVSIQAQILNLLKRLQSELGVAYLLITHDLSVVSYLSHEIAVMYLGKVVERGNTEEILRAPKHPYTQALLSAVPLPSITNSGGLIELQGELPSPVSIPTGCAFHPRCHLKLVNCQSEAPRLTTFGPSQSVSCHLYADARVVNLTNEAGKT